MPEGNAPPNTLVQRRQGTKERTRALIALLLVGVGPPLIAVVCLLRDYATAAILSGTLAPALASIIRHYFPGSPRQET